MAPERAMLSVTSKIILVGGCNLWFKGKINYQKQSFKFGNLFIRSTGIPPKQLYTNGLQPWKSECRQSSGAYLKEATADPHTSHLSGERNVR